MTPISRRGTEPEYQIDILGEQIPVTKERNLEQKQTFVIGIGVQGMNILGILQTVFQRRTGFGCLERASQQELSDGSGKIRSGLCKVPFALCKDACTGRSDDSCALKASSSSSSVSPSNLRFIRFVGMQVSKRHLKHYFCVDIDMPKIIAAEVCVKSIHVFRLTSIHAIVRNMSEFNETFVLFIISW